MNDAVSFLSGSLWNRFESDRHVGRMCGERAWLVSTSGSRPREVHERRLPTCSHPCENASGLLARAPEATTQGSTRAGSCCP